MEQVLVIKVKYGDSLWRFTAPLDGYGKLETSMSALKERIARLLDIVHYSDELKLTYVDEDGDEVALAHDDDLGEAVRQNIRPLRIRASVSRHHHPLQELFPNLKSGVAGVMKTLPDPLRDQITKTLSDIPPTSSDLIQKLARLLHPLLPPVSPPDRSERVTVNDDDDYPFADLFTNVKLRPVVEGLVRWSFVRDVTVEDGARMAPSARFTKTWTVRNSGSLPWYPGMALVWAKGSHMSDALSVEIQLPRGGLGVSEEMDVCVGCTSPERPGTYVSYWSLALPWGAPLPHHLWVEIQVVGPANVAGNVEPSSSSSSSSSPLPPLLSVEVVEGGSVNEAMTTEQLSLFKMEEDLLDEMSAMGFTVGELNRRVLKKNNYDLDLSVEDLCDNFNFHDAARRLREMGFMDESLNWELLEKNGGTIKDTVLDLIAHENKSNTSVD